MSNRLKTVGLIHVCLIFSASLYSQAVSEVSETKVEVVPNYNLNNNTTFTLPSFRSNTSFSGNSFSHRGGGSPMALFETFMRQMNFKLPPTGYRFVSANGMNLQAGLLMNSRQPKLGASFSMPRGFNISAGYGISSSNLMRPGSMSMGRTPGLQFSASYRLFKKK